MRAFAGIHSSAHALDARTRDGDAAVGDRVVLLPARVLDRMPPLEREIRRRQRRAYRAGDEEAGDEQN